jgi:bifunctional enzyme CysN/CysC
MKTNVETDTEYNVDEYLNRELLRFTTAGSVDDGKSTLIGRLLFDSKAIFQDQLDQLEHSSKLRGEEGVNLALLTDGLRSEREQGITIDVAYRYFSTPKRKFIIADTPGHIQYTRNMVTGASNADLAIILIDARYGVLTQSKRHGFIASLLGIPHVLVCVNKMDLVDYSQEVFDRIVKDYVGFSEKLNIHDMSFIPISALNGDNVVDKSELMPWYKGATVLHHLENVIISADKNLVDFRFPVQYVSRPNLNFRGFAGRIASGSIRKGEEIISLPSGTRSKIKEIVTYDGNLKEAFTGQSISLTLEDEIDISRGDMICRVNNQPRVENIFETTLCWMDDKKSLNKNTRYILQHTTRNVQAHIRELRYRIDVNTLHREDSETLDLNDIGRVVIETAMPLYFDPYEKNRETGSFILIDPISNLTVAAGMIRYEMAKPNFANQSEIFSGQSRNIQPAPGGISRELREAKQGYKAHVVWLTGLSGSGKSTIAQGVAQRLWSEGKAVFILDGDNIRSGICGDLEFSKKDRRENIRRVAHIAKLMLDAGQIVLCSFISPEKEQRDFVRKLMPTDRFSEILVDCDIEECRKRDVKGLYSKADQGEIPEFTGVSSPYEAPETADLVLFTDKESEGESIERVLTYVKTKL